MIIKNNKKVQLEYFNNLDSSKGSEPFWVIQALLFK